MSVTQNYKTVKRLCSAAGVLHLVAKGGQSAPDNFKKFSFGKARPDVVVEVEKLFRDFFALPVNNTIGTCSGNRTSNSEKAVKSVFAVSGRSCFFCFAGRELFGCTHVVSLSKFGSVA